MDLIKYYPHTGYLLQDKIEVKIKQKNKVNKKIYDKYDPVNVLVKERSMSYNMINNMVHGEIVTDHTYIKYERGKIVKYKSESMTYFSRGNLSELSVLVYHYGTRTTINPGNSYSSKKVYTYKMINDMLTNLNEVPDLFHSTKDHNDCFQCSRFKPYYSLITNRLVPRFKCKSNFCYDLGLSSS